MVALSALEELCMYGKKKYFQNGLLLRDGPAAERAKLAPADAKQHPYALWEVPHNGPDTQKDDEEANPQSGSDRKKMREAKHSQKHTEDTKKHTWSQGSGPKRKTRNDKVPFTEDDHTCNDEHKMNETRRCKTEL